MPCGFLPVNTGRASVGVGLGVTVGTTGGAGAGWGGAGGTVGVGVAAGVGTRFAVALSKTWGTPPMSVSSGPTGGSGGVGTGLTMRDRSRRAGVVDGGVLDLADLRVVVLLHRHGQRLAARRRLVEVADPFDRLAGLDRRGGRLRAVGVVDRPVVADDVVLRHLLLAVQRLTGQRVLGVVALRVRLGQDHPGRGRPVGSLDGGDDRDGVAVGVGEHRFVVDDHRRQGTPLVVERLVDRRDVDAVLVRWSTRRPSRTRRTGCRRCGAGSSRASGRSRPSCS